MVHSCSKKLPASAVPSSMSRQRADWFMYSSAYCASKAGVINMTKATALEYAALGIKVNAICPGVVWTPMVEQLCTSEEMKQMLLAITARRVVTGSIAAK